MSSNDRLRVPAGIGTLTGGVTLSGGGVVPVKTIHTKPLQIIKHRVELPGNVFALTAAATAGAADGQGLKIMELPVGKWLVLASRVDLSSVLTAGYTSSAAVYSVGTAAATADEAALTSTEADVLASQSLGDGGLSATAETDAAIVLGTGTAPALVGSTTAATPLYFNVAGSWIHATLTAALLTVSGSIELTLLDLGDI